VCERRRVLLRRLAVDVCEAPGYLEHPVVVCAAAGADAEVDRRTREALGWILAAQLELDVLVHDRDPGVAARIAILGAQELVQSLKICHSRSSSSLTG
jgi:hypothetical protein